MSLTDAFLDESGALQGLEGAASYVLEQYGVTPPTSYSDDFNRADGNLTTPWVTPDGNHPISSNKVVVGSSSPNTSYYDQTFTNDQWAEADLAGISVGGSTVGVSVRTASSSGGDLYYAWTDGSNHITIVKRFGGSYTTIATGSVAASGHKVALEVAGTTLNAYVDGVLAVTITDSNITTGKPGIISANGAGATIDNFRCGSGAYPGPPSSGFVKYRTFNGTSDWMTLNAAETVGQKMFNPGTAAVCLRRSRSDGSGDGGGYQEWFSGVYGAGSPLSVAVYFAPDNRLYSYDPASNGDEGGNALVVADGWLICAMSRVAASGNPRMHSYKFSTGPSSWSHVNTNNPAANNSPLDAGSFFEVSQQNGWNQFFAGDIAVLAYWHRALSDVEIETLPTSLAAWTALSPNHLWRMENTPVNDTVGTATQRSITGTTVSGSDSVLPVS